MNSRIPVFFVVVGSLLACDKPRSGSSQSPDQGRAASGDDATAVGGSGSSGQEEDEPGAPNVPWAQKTFKQRQQFMAIEVVPRMKELFKAQDAQAFDGF